jgi:hypothetical protein
MGRHLVGMRRPGLVLLLVAGALAATAGTAFAYWHTTGAGTGHGRTTTAQAVTLTPATPTAQLYPGGVSDVVLTVNNPNPSAIHLGSLALDTTQGTGGFGVDPAHSGCGLAVLAFTTQTNGGAGWTVPGKVNATNGTLAVTLTNALSMGTGAANACQNATFTVYLVAGP